MTYSHSWVAVSITMKSYIDTGIPYEILSIYVIKTISPFKNFKLNACSNLALFLSFVVHFRSFLAFVSHNLINVSTGVAHISNPAAIR